jgi:hypothetical protein
VRQPLNRDFTSHRLALFDTVFQPLADGDGRSLRVSVSVDLTCSDDDRSVRRAGRRAPDGWPRSTTSQGPNLAVSASARFFGSTPAHRKSTSIELPRCRGPNGVNAKAHFEEGYRIAFEVIDRRGAQTANTYVILANKTVEWTREVTVVKDHRKTPLLGAVRHSVETAAKRSPKSRAASKRRAAAG